MNIFDFIFTPLAITTHPLALTIRGSSFCQDPGMVHWEVEKRLLRYVEGTAGDGVLYNKGEDVEPRGYSYASYGSDLETKMGWSGFVTMGGRARNKPTEQDSRGGGSRICGAHTCSSGGAVLARVAGGDGGASCCVIISHP